MRLAYFSGQVANMSQSTALAIAAYKSSRQANDSLQAHTLLKLLVEPLPGKQQASGFAGTETAHEGTHRFEKARPPPRVADKCIWHGRLTAFHQSRNPFRLPHFSERPFPAHACFLIGKLPCAERAAMTIADPVNRDISGNGNANGSRWLIARHAVAPFNAFLRLRAETTRFDALINGRSRHSELSLTRERRFWLVSWSG